MVRNGCVVTRGDPVTLRLQLIAAADVVLIPLLAQRAEQAKQTVSNQLQSQGHPCPQRTGARWVCRGP